MLHKTINWFKSIHYLKLIAAALLPYLYYKSRSGISDNLPVGKFWPVRLFPCDYDFVVEIMMAFSFFPLIFLSCLIYIYASNAFRALLASLFAVIMSLTLYAALGYFASQTHLFGSYPEDYYLAAAPSTFITIGAFWLLFRHYSPAIKINRTTKIMIVFIGIAIALWSGLFFYFTYF